MAERKTKAPGHTTSFRRLIRVSIAAQVLVIAVVLAVTVVGALTTVRTSDQLRKRANDVLMLRGVQQEFERSRASLREYIASGDEIDLGPFSQARGQVMLISGTLRGDLDDDGRKQLDRYTDDVDLYLNRYGNEAVRLVGIGDRAAARELINGKAATTTLRAILAESRAVQKTVVERQRSAERTVRDRQIVNVVLITLGGTLILGAGLGILLWIRREMMIPLDELAVASRKLGHGDLSARVEPHGVEEIALAGTAFNQMADEVEQQVRQLQEVSSTRSRFVSAVSHELRTPITSLRGYLEMLAGGEAGRLEADQQRYVQIAERNARQLDELINDLLTLSRIQSGRITMNPEPIDVRMLLRELKAEMLPIASERDIDLVLVDTGDLMVSGDTLRLKQAFGNLIGNAIKYSPDGQAVVVRAFRLNRQVVVSVVDWGSGIPKEELPQIAEPFFRSSTTERVHGTGLGLAIAKQMIELHGGRLAVESEEGAGSTFTAYLPLRNDTAPLDDLPATGDGSAGGERESGAATAAEEERVSSESASGDSTRTGADRRRT